MSFSQCLPCGDEMAIAAICWHMLSCYRAGLEPVLLKDYRQDVKVASYLPSLNFDVALRRSRTS